MTFLIFQVNSIPPFGIAWRSWSTEKKFSLMNIRVRQWSFGLTSGFNPMGERRKKTILFLLKKGGLGLAVNVNIFECNSFWWISFFCRSLYFETIITCPDCGKEQESRDELRPLVWFQKATFLFLLQNIYCTLGMQGPYIN